jgi:hypothetical protein
MSVEFVLALLLVLVAVAAGVVIVRQRSALNHLRTENNALRADLDARDEELAYWVEVRLAAIAERLRDPAVVVPGLRDSRLGGSGFADCLQTALDAVAGIARESVARAEHKATETLLAMVARFHGLATEQQLIISEMEDRHHDPEVLDGLLILDHRTAQLIRRGQLVRGLCGSWTGQNRRDSPVLEVVRGAVGRIREFLRVQVPAAIELGVVSRAVEPVVLSVAELLDNATQCSPPDSMVEVCFQPTHNGLAIVIDDAGVGMTADQFRRAEMLLADGGIDIHRLADPNQIGFAGVGALAQRYGFGVTVAPSARYGGVCAVVFLPTELLTRTREHMGSTAGADTSPAGGGPVVQERPPQMTPAPQQMTAAGFPKRQRRRSVEPAATSPEVIPGNWSAPEIDLGGGAARALRAWQRGSRGARQGTGGEGERHP